MSTVVRRDSKRDAGRKERIKDSKQYEKLTLLKRSKTPLPANPGDAKLEAFRNTHQSRSYFVHFDCPEFTSLCPVTGQPDFGHITVRYVPNEWCLESKSLKLYLFSFRNCSVFHEDVVNRILNDIVRNIMPRQATVTGNFMPRGGISISIEASYPDPAVKR